MVSPLYLDTARLGKMTPGAQNVHHDFSRFAGEVGASILFNEFLWNGLEACPRGLAERFPALAAWKGVARLKQALCGLTTLPSRSEALLAGRSTQLMKLAATLLCRPCRHLLVTDIGWPPYHAVLDRECRRTNRQMTSVQLCRDLLAGNLDEQAVAKKICAAYSQNRCDGLFLTAVSHLGIRLPIQTIVERIERETELRFVVVDGAQDYCHVDSDLQQDCADLYLAGAHKWLGSFHPLGLAFYGKRRSRHVVESVLHDSLQHGHLDDPLLRFLHGGEEGNRPCPNETVNLSGLFSCQGAVSDAISEDADKVAQFANRLANARQVAELASSSGWFPENPHASLQSGILLLNTKQEQIRSLSAEELRGRFYQHGIALTGYDRGRVRLSMPGERLQDAELETVQRAFQEVA